MFPDNRSFDPCPAGSGAVRPLIGLEIFLLDDALEATQDSAGVWVVENPEIEDVPSRT